MRERLYRSRDDRMLFGVAGGMAEWLDLDASIVRLVWALLIVAGGVGLLLYVIAAIVVPEAPFAPAGAAGAGATTGTGPSPGSEQSWREARRARRAARRENRNPGVVFGVILVLLGTWFLVRHYLPAFDMSWFLPGMLIVVGVVLVAGALGRSGGGGQD